MNKLRGDRRVAKTSPRSNAKARETLLDLIDCYLREGASIEINGPGKLKLSSADQGRAGKPIRVFLGYADEDRAVVKQLCGALLRSDFEPWMGGERLLPGQNWPITIEKAIDRADFVILCFSRRSVNKRGHFQCEVEYAMRAARRVPAGEIYLLPARLDDCELPRDIALRVQHVDLFPDWRRGVDELLRAMWRQTLERQQPVRVTG